MPIDAPDHHDHHCCGVSDNPEDYFLTRRQWLNRFGMGLGALGLASLVDPNHLVADTVLPNAATANRPKVYQGPLAPKTPMFPAKAKRVIHIFAQGAPSHVDTWDPKPELTKMDGRSLDGGVALGSPFKFTPMGQSGIPVSEVFSKVGEHVDDMAIIRSMHTDIPAHEVATVFMNTGSLRIVKPSMGSWVVYGLGTVNQNLPGFIALRNGGLPSGGATNYGAGFLPGVFQGTSINMQSPTVAQMIQNIHNNYVQRNEQRRQIDLVKQLDEIQSRNLEKDAELEARLQSYEIAFKMQTAATDVFDISKERPDVRAAYGNTPTGRQLLVARRLVENGVRFVQVWHDGWDHHQDIQKRLAAKAREIDQPLAALLTDLKQRGMLEDTLVIWGGEFGRKPIRDKNGTGDTAGRDHNSRGFCAWLAGGGIKGGTIHGATDQFGSEAVKDPVDIHDLHATILACLGMDHKKLTYRFNGRDFRLTDVSGNVVNDIIA